jgi:hypothetical protein
MSFSDPTKWYWSVSFSYFFNGKRCCGRWAVWVLYLIIYMRFECRLSPPLRQVAALAPVAVCVSVAGAVQFKAEDTWSTMTIFLLSKTTIYTLSIVWVCSSLAVFLPNRTDSSPYTLQYWIWKRHVPPKCLYPLTSPHGVTNQKITAWMTSTFQTSFYLDI